MRFFTLLSLFCSVIFAFNEIGSVSAMEEAVHLVETNLDDMYEHDDGFEELSGEQFLEEPSAISVKLKEDPDFQQLNSLVEESESESDETGSEEITLK
ncbi:Pseudouridylate synthase PUS7L [Trichinella pseudospiralis]